MSIVMVNKNKLIYRSTSYSKFSNNLLSKLLGSNQSLVLRVASWYEPVQSFHQCLDYDFLSSMLSNIVYNDNLAWLIGFLYFKRLAAKIILTIWYWHGCFLASLSILFQIEFLVANLTYCLMLFSSVLLYGLAIFMF